MKSEPADPDGAADRVIIPRQSSPPKSVASGSRKGGSSKAGAPTERVLAPDGEATLDSEMQRVQDKLGPPFQPCLAGLSADRILAGEKLGVRVASARASLSRSVEWCSVDFQAVRATRRAYSVRSLQLEASLT